MQYIPKISIRQAKTPHNRRNLLFLKNKIKKFNKSENMIVKKPPILYAVFKGERNEAD